MASQMGERVVVIGGGPAGLVAAEVLSRAGIRVDLYDAMPSLGRKFLMAGKGGMNLTHSEPLEQLLARYGSRRDWLDPLIHRFGPGQLRDWAKGLGVETFVGSSRRVFPVEMKAAPLLRAWLHRLRECGVRFHVRHRWQGWHESGRLLFHTPAGECQVEADAVILALGGGSWPQLGSTGAWVPWLRQCGVAVSALRPANCGFELVWTDYFRQHFAGAALKSVTISFVDVSGQPQRQQGDMVISEYGLEGSLIYAISAPLRDLITRDGKVEVCLDLLPGHEQDGLVRLLSKPRGSRSLAKHLKAQIGLEGVKASLLREALTGKQMQDSACLARTIKALPLTLLAPRPIEEAISSAGGVEISQLDSHLMLHALPGVFCAGEMIDWEAPTGGYLFTASFATGVAAAEGVLNWLAR